MYSYLTLNFPTDFVITIVDEQGKEVLSKEVVAYQNFSWGETTVIPAGLYFYTISIPSKGLQKSGTITVVE